MSKHSASSASARRSSRPIVFCDFDGTVTLADITDCILEELADPTWRELEAAWVGGQIGSRECLERQMALVQASPKELNALIDGIAIDPGFASFYTYVEKRGLPFYIFCDDRTSSVPSCGGPARMASCATGSTCLPAP